MAKITPSPFWADLDFSAKAKIWQQNRAGTQVATGASKMPIESLRAAINHLAAFQPATLFSLTVATDYSYVGDADPLAQWYSYDYLANNRDMTIGMINWSSNNDDAYFYREDDTNYRSGDCSENWHWNFQQIKIGRNAPSMNVTVDGLSQVADSNLELLDMVVQEDPTYLLDTDDHSYVSPSGYRDMSPIRTTELEDIRSVFHTLRTRNLPLAMCWSALTQVNCSATQAAEHTGIAITSATYLNIWDLTSTTRTATSPGSHVYAYRAAVGNETNNKNVKVLCAVLARVIDNSGSPEGTIKFIGPDHAASNYCEISVTNTDYQWLGAGVSDFIYLNSAADYDDATTECNKIDIHGKVTASDVLQIIGVACMRVYQ